MLWCFIKMCMIIFWVWKFSTDQDHFVCVLYMCHQLNNDEIIALLETIHNAGEINPAMRIIPETKLTCNFKNEIRTPELRRRFSFCRRSTHPSPPPPYTRTHTTKLWKGRFWRSTPSFQLNISEKGLLARPIVKITNQKFSQKNRVLKLSVRCWTNW